MKNIRTTIRYALILSLAFIVTAHAQRLPSRPVPAQAVNDFANVIPASFKQQIEAICHELWEKTNTAIVIVTIETLEGENLEDYANRLYESWGIGKRGEDKGVLILNVVGDRKVRIETGYGLEGILPDGKVGQIIDDEMIPLLRQRNYGQAYLNAVITIAQIIAADEGVELTGENKSQHPEDNVAPGGRIGGLATILFIIFLLIITRGRILPWLILSSMSSGRGDRDDWGGFGGRGGGFGGGFGGFGGGMSGGGGASRSY